VHIFRLGMYFSCCLLVNFVTRPWKTQLYFLTLDWCFIFIVCISFVSGLQIAKKKYKRILPLSFSDSYSEWTLPFGPTFNDIHFLAAILLNYLVTKSNRTNTVIWICIFGRLSFVKNNFTLGVRYHFGYTFLLILIKARVRDV
jgi:hypothetical protein